MVQPKSNIVHLPVYQPGKPIEDVKRELGLSEVVKLASNENPFGCSPQARQAIAAMAEQTPIYPDGASVELTAAVSAHLGVESDRIIFGAGLDEVITMLCRAYLDSGDETVMASHTFPQYRHNALIEGALCHEVPLASGRHDLAAMAERITGKTKIVWICNPNNPTGTIVTHAEVEQFLARVPENVMVVLDEAYIEFVERADFPDSLRLLEAHKNVVLLRTFSKIYGLAALRIGYAVGHPELIRSVNQVRGPFNTSSLAQAAAKAALQDQAFVRSCKAANLKGLAYFAEAFERLGLRAFPSSGNFALVDTERPADRMFSALLARGIIVRGGHQLGFPTMLRVTVGNEEQNRKFVHALEAVVQDIPKAEHLTAK